MIGRSFLHVFLLLVAVEAWRLQSATHHRHLASLPLVRMAEGDSRAAQKAAELIGSMSLSALKGIEPGKMPVMKEFVSSVKIRHKHMIQALPGGTVQDYMRLPVEQYAIYDPRLMSRVTSSGDGDETIFELRLPRMRTSASDMLMPNPKVRLRVLPTSDSISIESVSASLYEDVETSKLPPNMTAEQLKQVSEEMKQFFNLDFNTTLAWRPSRKRKTAKGDTDLTATTLVSLKIAMPPPFTRVPRPLVQGAIGLIMRFVGGAILPRFAKLLEMDYQRWCNGTRNDLSAGLPGLPIDDDGFMIVDPKDLEAMKAQGGVVRFAADSATLENVTDEDDLNSRFDEILKAAESSNGEADRVPT